MLLECACVVLISEEDRFHFMSRASTNMCSSVILSSKQCNSDGIDLIAQLVERQALELLGVGSNPPSVSVFVKRK